MTDRSARTVANVILASAGATAAIVVLTTPPLRRLAFRASRVWLFTTLPLFLLNETRKAWAESKAG